MGNSQQQIPEKLLYKHFPLYEKLSHNQQCQVFANRKNLADKIQLYHFVFKESNCKSETIPEVEESDQIFIENEKNLTENLQVYLNRKLCKERIVRVLGVLPLETKQSGICSELSTQVTIVIEGIQYRISEIKTMTEFDFMVLLYNTLIGYQELNKKLPQDIQYFKLTEEMIGINRYGHTKVWFNENFAANYPSNIKIIRSRTQKNNYELKSFKQITKMLNEKIKINNFNATQNKNPNEYKKLMGLLQKSSSVKQYLLKIKYFYEKDAFIDFDTARIEINRVNAYFYFYQHHSNQNFDEFKEKEHQHHQRKHSPFCKKLCGNRRRISSKIPREYLQ